MVSLWVAAFAMGAALQVFRGDRTDFVLFAGAGLVVLASTTILKNVSFPTRRLISGRQLDWTGLVLLVALAFTPRHTPFNFAIFILLLPIAVSLSWGEHSQPSRELTKRDRNTRLVWSVWAIATCLWEFAANILGQLSPDPNNFPTISVLMDPVLLTEVGQAGFVLAWLTLGYYLLKAGSK